MDGCDSTGQSIRFGDLENFRESLPSVFCSG